MLRSLISSKPLQYTFASIVAMYCIFLQFYHLGELPIVQWDESRLAVNAAEMYESGDFLVTSFENQPDLYNTKPPLMVILQVISAYIFGLNEFSIRFPSAVAGIICIFLCGFMVYKKTSDIYSSCLASLLLATSKGFIQLHGSMTGDYDALLSVFILTSIYHHQNYLLHRSKKSYIYLILALSFAILSKSAAGFLFMPVLVFGSLVRSNSRKFAKTILACILASLPFILFCMIRESASTGYLDAVKNNDFLGRLTSALEGHTSSWYYYIINLFEFRFNYFIWLLVPALVIGFKGSSKTFLYYCLSFTVYLILLSCAQTRIHWYDMPLLPLIAIIISLAVATTYKNIQKPIYKYGIIICVALGLVWPIISKTEFIAHRKGLELDKTHYELSNLLRNYKGNQQTLYIAAPYDAEFYFYSILNPNILRADYKTLQVNDIVFYGNVYKDSVDMRYKYTILDSGNNARKIHIDSLKH